MWQADWLDVVLVVGIPIQDQDGDVEAIRLGSKSKIGMQSYLRHREHLVRQGFDVGVKDVIPQSHTDRGWIMLGPGDAVTSGHHMLGTDQGTTASGSTHLDKCLRLKEKSAANKTKTT